jgi:hypothetical protein
MTTGHPHTDSPTGRQYHVRYRIVSHGPDADPFWTHFSDNETDTQRTLATYQREEGVADVQLWAREVTPWRPVA